jgi:hypothetical protein
MPGVVRLIMVVVKTTWPPLGYEIILQEGGDAARRIWAYLEPLRR